MAEGADLDWSPDGAPISRRFGDIYFSRADGLAETRAVFLEGCGLPEAWNGRARFTVAELGLGTGLNILALLDLWGSHRRPDQRLQVFSVEAYPLTRQEMQRATAAWPELADLAGQLAQQWPTANGFHRIDLPGLGATLDVAVMEAAEALGGWTGKADAWLLDGFAPARNPEMWRGEVLRLVALRSAPGARAATFTVAQAVREGLGANGFEVAKRPGFGAKRQRLEAWLPLGDADDRRRPGPPRVCIIGAGVAGAALARAFLARGVTPVVLDAEGPGAGASGNPAALVTPRLDAGGGPIAQLHAQAFRRAVTLYRSECPAAIIATGALQLEVAERDNARFDRLAASDLFEPDALSRLGAEQTGQRLGEPVDVGGLWIGDGLTIAPNEVLRRWLEGCEARLARAATLERRDGSWSVLTLDGAVACEADVICLAAGCASAALADGLSLEPVRGQISLIATSARPQAAAWGGYVIPTAEGFLYGATHDRGRADTDEQPHDHLRNLAVLAQKRPELAASLAGAEPTGKVGIRASTPDRSPIAGPVAGSDGLYVLAGLGGRGFTLAPLLGEHIASLILDEASPLPGSLSASLDPDRFRIRSARREQP